MIPKVKGKIKIGYWCGKLFSQSTASRYDMVSVEIDVILPYSG